MEWNCGKKSDYFVICENIILSKGYQKRFICIFWLKNSEIKCIKSVFFSDPLWYSVLIKLFLKVYGAGIIKFQRNLLKKTINHNKNYNYCIKIPFQNFVMWIEDWHPNNILIIKNSLKCFNKIHSYYVITRSYLFNFINTFKFTSARANFVNSLLN